MLQPRYNRCVSVAYDAICVCCTLPLFFTSVLQRISVRMKRIGETRHAPPMAGLPRQPVPLERYSWKGMLSPAMLAFCVSCMGLAVPPALPPVSLATFGVGDTLLIVVVALIVFGPKKLPEISRQIGKLLYEFRKASNDFKFQIEEELRAAEQAERQKELTAQAATVQPATPVAIAAGETVSAEPVTDGVHAAGPAASATADSSSATPEHAEESQPELAGTPSIQPPASGP